jgi:hypothetical protein
MEVMRFPETSVYVRTTLRYVPEGGNIQYFLRFAEMFMISLDSNLFRSCSCGIGITAQLESKRTFHTVFTSMLLQDH